MPKPKSLRYSGYPSEESDAEYDEEDENEQGDESRKDYEMGGYSDQDITDYQSTNHTNKDVSAQLGPLACLLTSALSPPARVMMLHAIVHLGAAHAGPSKVHLPELDDPRPLASSRLRPVQDSRDPPVDVKRPTTF